MCPAFAVLQDSLLDSRVRMGNTRATAGIQIAGRGGDRGGRNDGSRNDGGRGRDAHRDKKGDVIWRIRRDRDRPFFLFRGRGDCTTQKVKVRDFSGNLVIREKRVCN